MNRLRLFGQFNGIARGGNVPNTNPPVVAGRGHCFAVRPECHCLDPIGVGRKPIGHRAVVEVPNPQNMIVADRGQQFSSRIDGHAGDDRNFFHAGVFVQFDNANRNLPGRYRRLPRKSPRKR